MMCPPLYTQPAVIFCRLLLYYESASINLLIPELPVIFKKHLVTGQYGKLNDVFATVSIVTVMPLISPAIHAFPVLL